MNTKSKKGFTLVEIMIVVVIIGLLAAMAIPAFQKVRENSIKSRTDNDARQLASAAQQYYMEENSEDTDTLTYNVDTGALTGNLEGYLDQLGRGYDEFPSDGLNRGENFIMGHPLLDENREYNPEGQFLDDVGTNTD